MGIPQPIDLDTMERPPAVLPGAAPARAAVAVPPRGTPSRRPRIASTLAAGVCLATLWAALSPGDAGSWTVGVPSVAAGALAYGALAPATARARICWPGAVRFAAYFALQATRGAVDVALRAVLPGRRVDPGFVEIEVGLPAGAGRVLFANALSLLPGTLTAELRGGRAVIHVIDRHADIGRDVEDLRRRVRAVYRNGHDT